jgi:hypothetical protein
LKSIAIFIATLCLAALSSNAFSSEQWQTSWKGIGNLSISDYQIAAKVTHSSNTKTIVFIIEDEYTESCDLAGTMMYRNTETVIYIDDQAISAIGKCSKHEGGILYNFIPKSEAGRKYVVGLFKVKTAPASISIGNIRFQLPTQGFSRVWNSVSDGVL